MSALPVILETVVVEGRDDESAVLRAVNADIICTHGYGITQQPLELIAAAAKKKGIIIFTDPDFAGNNIRKRLTGLFPQAKQAYLTRDDAFKEGDIGVENASPEAIAEALLAAKASRAEARAEEEMLKPEDMVMLGLSGSAESASLRKSAGRLLGIGSCNASAFLKRLNSFGITREELAQACSRALTENQ